MAKKTPDNAHEMAQKLLAGDRRAAARMISLIENQSEKATRL
jgi:putative protein kinase ArgK-like GTPase of G3E family